MTDGEKKYDLSRYRIKQAEESLDEAKYLLAGGKSPRSVINRAYYAMFYAVLALLVLLNRPLLPDFRPSPTAT